MVLMNLFSGDNGESDIESRLRTRWEGERERVRCMERVTRKFITSYVK